MKTIRRALLSLALFSTGCSLTLVPDYAIAAFSRDQSCPTTRIAMKKVLVDPEIAFVGPAPPADVAADAGRLEVWRANARSDLAEYNNLMAIDLTGCDVHRTYLCWDTWDAGTETIDQHCHEVDLNNPDLQLQGYRITNSARRSWQEAFEKM